MPSDLIAERLRIVTGSMEFTVSAVNTINPNGSVTEPSGSIIRAQDGSVWTNTDGGTSWTNTGPSGLSSLSGTIDSGIKALSGTVDARFIDLTGSLVSSITETNSSLRAGVTASINSIYSTILAGTSASDAAVQVSLKAGTTASLQQYYTTIIAGTSASDAAVQTSLKAGVTASFGSWPSDVAIQGALEVTGSTNIKGKVMLRGGGTSNMDSIVGGIEFGVGRNATDEVAGIGTARDIAFNWIGGGGGYRHWISTNHQSLASDVGNAIKFWLNDSTGSIGSLAPNTGSYLALALHGDRTVRTSSSLTVAGSITGSGDAVFSRKVGIGGGSTSTIPLTVNGVAGVSAAIFRNANQTTTDIQIDRDGVNNQGFIRYDDSATDLSLSMAAASNKHLKISGAGVVTVAKDLVVAGATTGSGDAKFSRNASVANTLSVLGGAAPAIDLTGSTGAYLSIRGPQDGANPHIKLQTTSVPSSNIWGIRLRGPEEGDFWIHDEVNNLKRLYIDPRGKVTIFKDAEVSQSLIVSGTARIGSVSTAQHYVLGQLNVNGTPGATSQVLMYYQGAPQWVALSGAGGISGIGTSGYIPVWSGQYALGDSLITSNASQNTVGTAGNVSIVGGAGSYTSGDQQLYVSHTGTLVPLSRDAKMLEILGPSLGFDTTGSARSMYGIKVSVFGSQSLGTNAMTTYGAYIDTTTTAGANGSAYAIWTQQGNVLLNANTAYSTEVRGTTYAKGYVYLNYLNGNVQSTDIHGQVFMRSGSYVDGAMTGTLDITISRNASIGGALTGSNSVRVGKELTVVGSITGSAYMVGTVSGKLLVGRQIFTGSTTYTPTAGTRAILVRMVGGGGGGGGGQTGGSGFVGGGGSSGGYFEKFFSSVTSATGSVIVGAGGTGGDNTIGGFGGDTAFSINTVTYVAKGGRGAPNTIGYGVCSGGLPQIGTSAGDVWMNGEAGGPGLYLNLTTPTFYGQGGQGGNSPFGQGGGSTVITAGAQSYTGRNPSGYGAGGGGGCDGLGTGTHYSGSWGSPGLVIIDEFA